MQCTVSSSVTKHFQKSQLARPEKNWLNNKNLNRRRPDNKLAPTVIASLSADVPKQFKLQKLCEKFLLVKKFTLLMNCCWCSAADPLMFVHWCWCTADDKLLLMHWCWCWCTADYAHPSQTRPSISCFRIFLDAVNFCNSCIFAEVHWVQWTFAIGALKLDAVQCSAVLHSYRAMQCIFAMQKMQLSAMCSAEQCSECTFAVGALATLAQRPPLSSSAPAAAHLRSALINTTIDKDIS